MTCHWIVVVILLVLLSSLLPTVVDTFSLVEPTSRTTTTTRPQLTCCNVTQHGSSNAEITTTRWDSEIPETISYDGDFMPLLLTTRRDIIIRTIVGSYFATTSASNGATVDGAGVSKPIAGVDNADIVRGTIQLSDDVISSLTYRKILGRGAFKTVYLVTSSPSSELQNSIKWALAVEKVASKSDAKAAIHGIQISEQLETILRTRNDGINSYYQDSFERVERWWFQSTSLPEFQPNQQVFIDYLEDENKRDRTQVIPRKYLGRSKYLVALKPAYDIDLKKFVDVTPLRYPIGSSLGKNSTRVVAGIDLNEKDTSALRLVYEICDVGRIMHSVGLVHRDIKPKNIMLHNGGRPVVIDFGFAEFVTTAKGIIKRVCIEEPGKMKGEKGYMLAKDAAKFLGCTEGDTYAMGKTLYETIFGRGQKPKPSPTSTSSSSLLGISSSSSSSSSTSSMGSSSSSSSSSVKMTVDTIQAKETAFRRILASKNAGRKSRFLLTDQGRDTILYVIRGLCDERNPISFAEAVEYLSKYV